MTYVDGQDDKPGVAIEAGDRRGDRVRVTRWRALEGKPQAIRLDMPRTCDAVAVTLRRVDMRIMASGRIVHDGTVLAGSVLVTPPSPATDCVFRGPADLLMLEVPAAVIADCSCSVLGQPGATFGATPRLLHDPIVEQLARVLMAADDLGVPFADGSVDYVATAIVARLLALGPSGPGADHRPAGLAAWRLKRAIDYIEARLDEPLRLAEIASVTGLTRMHFAAQFRAATGVRPHEYLLRRRVERAQELLTQRNASLVDVALSVGFQNQSHFTTVFKRFVGQPPRAWCQAHGYGA